MSLPETNLAETQLKRKRKVKIKRILINIFVFIISAAVWCSVVYYGYTYAKDYIDTAIKNVQQQNAVNIQQLNERIDLMTKEINGLREAIEDADSSLSYSTKVQRRIDGKLKELDARLKELKNSLEVLKEAPGIKEAGNVQD